MPENGDRTGGESAPEVSDAVVREHSRISLVWLIPIVATLIGGWLTYRALSERGPEVLITFESAAGLEAQTTKIKYKDVEVGEVESIRLSDDISHVEVRARLVRGASHYLTENTRFWVVRARVSAGQVSGLGTLFSGAYIGMDPSTEGATTREFVGLEEPPAFTSDEPGRVFHLRGTSLGSLDVGSPVYFRWISVGEVVGYELDQAGEYVSVQIFVRAPHDQRVHRGTQFWNASGFDVSLSPEGVELDSVSLTSILIGGIAFETPDDPDAAEPPDEGQVFNLYPNKQATTRPAITLARPFLLHFEQSAAGLVKGSPVEFRGIQIGEVHDVHMTFDEQAQMPRIPVLIHVQPERIRFARGDDDGLRERWDGMVARGLRAQLKTHNLLTGQLAVGFDFFPNAEPARIDWTEPVPELPTIPSPIEELKAGLAQFLDKLNELPLDEIGDDLRASLANLNDVLQQIEAATPALTATLGSAERTLASADALIAPDSQVSLELRRTLRELADAARSLRLLADQLEQHPESLIQGKEAGR